MTCPTSKICSVSYLVNEEATVPCLLFYHENHALNYAQNYFPSEPMCCLAEKGIGSVEIGEVFKNCVNLCNISVLIYDLRKRAQSNLTLCKVTSWMNMVYYSDQYLLYWQSKYSLRWNKASSVNIMSVVTVSPLYTARRYPLQNSFLLLDQCHRVCALQLT